MPRGEIRSANLPTTRGVDVQVHPLLANQEAHDRWKQRLAEYEGRVILDLFSGAGGMSAGFESEGFFVAAGIDSEAHACRTHAANFLSKSPALDLSQVHSPGDARAIVKELGIERVDVVVGGPPCQGFSVVGRARIRSLPKAEQREVILKRNELYRNFLYFVEALRPPIFLMENVQTMRTWEDGLYFDDILETTRRMDYEPFHGVLNAADFGVPQFRRRQFIVGSRTGTRFRFPRSRQTPQVTLAQAIDDLPSVTAPCLEERQRYIGPPRTPYQELMRSRVHPDERDIIHDHVVRPVRDDDREIFTAMEPGHRYLDVDPRYRRYKDNSFTDKYYKLRPDAPCVTITAHLSKDGYRYIHYDREQCRTLSVREAARVQSFDDAFRFAGHRSNRYQQIGNAVPPLLAAELAARVRRALEGHTEVLEDDPWQLDLPLHATL